MESQDDHHIHERVELLERELAEIKKLLQRIAPSLTSPRPEPSPQPSPAPAPPPPSQPAPTSQVPRPAPSQLPPIPPPRSFELPDYMRKSEFWLSRIGIGLLLFGLAFLFKYSIDQGWITPPVRHFFGIGIGVILFIFGWRLYAKRKHLSRLLLGGSVAAFYITDFSAFQLFELVSHPTALALMVLVTVLAFFISLRQDDALFSVVGAIGGLATPFLLHSGPGSVPGLVGYTCLVLAGTAAVGFFKQWRGLLWVSGIGGWMVLMVGIDAASVLTDKALSSAQWSLQGGILLWWLFHAVVPVGRRVLSATKPDRWKNVSPLSSRVVSSQALEAMEQHLHLLAVLAPLTALFTSTGVWPETPDYIFGWVAMGAAVVYFGGGHLLRKFDELTSLAYAQAISATVLFTVALAMLLDGNALMLAFTGEAVALHLLARPLSNRGVSFGGHVLSFVVGIWLLIHLLATDGESPAVFNSLGLTDLVVILAAAGVGLRVLTNTARMIYTLASHLAFLCWLARELSTLENGQGYVTIAWGVYGAILLIAALRLNSTRLRQVSLGTLVLLVGKLFIVDLAELETIWRVLLFMGFGAVFLLLSYYFPKLWRGPTDK